MQWKEITLWEPQIQTGSYCTVRYTIIALTQRAVYEN